MRARRRDSGVSRYVSGCRICGDGCSGGRRHSSRSELKALRLPRAPIRPRAGFHPSPGNSTTSSSSHSFSAASSAAAENHSSASTGLVLRTRTRPPPRSLKARISPSPERLLGEEYGVASWDRLWGHRGPVLPAQFMRRVVSERLGIAPDEIAAGHSSRSASRRTSPTCSSVRWPRLSDLNPSRVG